MTSYKLNYFDIDGGRAEPVRIAFHSAGIEFEDHRISFAEFAEARKATRFSCMPTLEIDGVEVTQSNTMCRYVGKLAGLYPEDDLQAVYCDEAMDAIEDLLHHIVQTFGLEGDELKAAREKLREGWLTIFIRGFDQLLARGGDYLADNRLTVADLKLFVQVRALLSGTLDHIPPEMVGQLAPRLLKHHELIGSDPIVLAYYASRS